MAENQTTTLTNGTKKVRISRDRATVIIGERINPTGRKKVLRALEAGEFESVREDAVKQVAAGAKVLDINAGVPGADEVELLSRVMQEVMEVVDVPLCIDTANPKALEAALKIYDGKALVNSVNGEEASLKTVLPLVKEYGAAVIGLCMNDNGIPATPEERVAVAETVINEAAKFGIPINDIVIDPLAMTMGADSNAGLITLETIRLIVKEFGVNLTMGASNVSFGMPDRKYINATFLAMAIQAGMTCPIANPLELELVTSTLASDLSLGRDEFGMGWIKAYRKRNK
ncbi:MAG: dihydropteroate synthase [Anaerolineaceae bacterium]|nr:dihydropteroate synthase [Anaerolineaceae bacterium]